MYFDWRSRENNAQKYPITHQWNVVNCRLFFIDITHTDISLIYFTLPNTNASHHYPVSNKAILEDVGKMH